MHEKKAVGSINTTPHQQYSSITLGACTTNHLLPQRTMGRNAQTSTACEFRTAAPATIGFYYYLCSLSYLVSTSSPLRSIRLLKPISPLVYLSSCTPVLCPCSPRGNIEAYSPSRLSCDNAPNFARPPHDIIYAGTHVRWFNYRVRGAWAPPTASCRDGIARHGPQHPRHPALSLVLKRWRVRLDQPTHSKYSNSISNKLYYPICLTFPM